MNILILNYEYPPLGGGAGVVSRYHAEGLSKAGHKTTVLTTWFEGENEIEESGNLKIIKLKSKRKYTFKSTPDEWISWISKSKRFLNDFLKTNKFDYCFAHFSLPGGEVAKYIYKKHKIPYAVISHGQDIPWFFPKQMFKYHLFTYFWIKQICKKADNIILLTDVMKKNADRFMGKLKHKNIIIPNACETNIFLPNQSEKSQTFKILFIGRLVSQKDPLTFLKSVKILKQTIGPDFIVHVLGDGPLKEKMQNFVKENSLSDVVFFKGWINKEDMLQEYQSAHIQIISSKAEAMSIAALESLSAGLYVISTPVSGNTDIIKFGINGEFFNFNDYKNLASITENYYKTKFLKNYRIPVDFLKEFRQNYDWSAIINKLDAVIPKIG